MPSDSLATAMSGCDADAISLIRQQSQIRVYEKGTHLYEQSETAESIYLLLDGCIIVERTSAAGTVTSFRIAARGDFLGHRSFFADEPRTTAPRCISTTRAMVVPGSAVRQAIGLDPEIGRVLARELARDDGPRLGAVVRSHRVLGITRLAFLLHHLHEKLSVAARTEPDGFEMPFSQHDLANLLDLRNETVSRLLRQLQDMGMVRVLVNPRRIALSDRTALTEFIEEHL